MSAITGGVHKRGGVERPIPVCKFPGAPTERAWRERIEPPAVTYRCGRGSKRCERLAFIFETDHDLGAVLVFHLHVAPQPTVVPDQIASHPELAQHLATRFKYVPGRDRAYSMGLKDAEGTVVALEDDRWWNAATVACGHHLGQTELELDALLRDLSRARDKGRPIDVTLRP